MDQNQQSSPITPWADLVTAECALQGVDEKLVLAIIQTESSGNSWAMRYEPGYNYPYFVRQLAEKIGCSYDTELTAQKTSWGLMQIMGGVVREIGFQGWLTMLCQPGVGIHYGVTHLKKKLQTYAAESDAVSAWNAGNVRKTPGGLYENQRYVDKVYQVLNELRKLH